MRIHFANQWFSLSYKARPTVSANILYSWWKQIGKKCDWPDHSAKSCGSATFNCLPTPLKLQVGNIQLPDHSAKSYGSATFNCLTTPLKATGRRLIILVMTMGKFTYFLFARLIKSVANWHRNRFQQSLATPLFIVLLHCNTLKKNKIRSLEVNIK